MKLVKLTCPNCNSILEVNDEMKQFTCNYCGTTTLLDDEIIKVKHTSSKLSNLLEDLKDYYDSGNFIKCYEMANELLEDYPKNKEILSYVHNKKIIKKVEEEKIIKEIELLKSKIDNFSVFTNYYYAQNCIKKFYECYKDKYSYLPITGETEMSIKKYKKNYNFTAIIVLIICFIVLFYMLFVYVFTPYYMN